MPAPMRTEALLFDVCKSLSTNCGDMHEAARENGISPKFLLDWAKDDPQAGAQMNEACRVGWMGLESAAIRRAVHGVDKGIYFKGELIATEKQYSDSLLVKLMEARLPEYKTKSLAESTNNVFHGPVQMNMMPRAANFDEWLEMKRVMDTNTPKPALPAPPVVLQGDYVAVSDGAHHAAEAKRIDDALEPVRGRPRNNPFEGIGL